MALQYWIMCIVLSSNIYVVLNNAFDLFISCLVEMRHIISFPSNQCVLYGQIAPRSNTTVGFKTQRPAESIGGIIN